MILETTVLVKPYTHTHTHTHTHTQHTTHNTHTHTDAKFSGHQHQKYSASTFLSMARKVNFTPNPPTLGKTEKKKKIEAYFHRSQTC